MRCNNCGWANPDGVERCQKCNQELDCSIPLPEMEEGVTMEQNAAVAQSSEISVEDVQYSCHQCGYPLDKSVTECPMCGTAVSRKESVSPTPQVQQSQEQNVINAMKATVVATAVIEQVEQQAEALVKSRKAEQVSRQANDKFKSTVVDASAVVASATMETPKSENNAFKQTVRDVHAVEQKAINTKQTIRDVHATEQKAAPANMKQTVRDVSSLNIGGESAPKSAPQSEARVGFSLTSVDGYGAGAEKLEFSESSIVLNRGNVDKDNLSIDKNAQLSLSCEGGEWYISNLSALQNTYIVPSRKTKIEAGDIIIIGNKRYIFG